MSADEIHQGDIGTEFIITVMRGAEIEPLQTATVKNLIFKKPSLTSVTKPTEFVTDGSDGQLVYTTVEGDLNEVGDYEWQLYLDLPGWKGHSDVGTFPVHKNL